MQCSALRKNGHVVIKGTSIYVLFYDLLNRYTQAALARSLTCPPPRLESTVTPRSILLLLMYVFPQLLWSLVSNFHLDFYRKEVGEFLALVTFRFDE